MVCLRKIPKKYKVFLGILRIWCGQGESNSRLLLGKESSYH